MHRARRLASPRPPLRALLLLVGTAATALAQTPPATRGPFDGPASTTLATPSVTIPLTKDGGFYYVDVELDGRPFRFTLETGAGFFGISGRAARALGLRVDSVEVMPGTRAPVATVDSLRIGGALFRGLSARVNATWDDASFDGILSIPLLRQVLATLDLPASRLRLEHGALPEPNGRDVLPILGVDRGRRVDIPIAFGGVTVPAVLDTRADFWIIAPDSLEPTLSLAAPPRFVTDAFGPSMGAFQLRGARLATDVRVGHLTLERPAVMLRNRPGVLIGVPLLEQVTLAIDLRNQRVRVGRAGAGVAFAMPPQAWELDTTAVARGPARAAPSGAPNAAAALPSGTWTVGFLMQGTPGGSLRVARVLPGSNAERVGVRAGDQVVEFDGTPAASMTPAIARAAATRGTPVALVLLREGRRLALTVTPYQVP